MAGLGTGERLPTSETRKQITNNVDAAPVDVVVTLARSKIRTADLLGLAIGDVIATEQETSNALELSIQDVPKFQAKPGAFKGKKAVRIESALKPTADEKQSPPNAQTPASGAESID